MMEFKSLKDHVYDYLSTQIQQNRLKPGEKINEKTLCDHLGISRTPVREALIELANEDLLERRPRRGFLVKALTKEEVKEIYKVLGCLEGVAAAGAISCLSAREFTAMEVLIRSMDEAILKKKSERFYKLQKDFHDVYISACGNKHLVRIINSVKSRFLRQAYRQLETEEDHFRALRQFNDEHRVVLELLQAGKKDELEDYLKDVHWNVDYARMDTF
jgi:DNA-binding GntR family transcriptional regulator